ncbi:MAG: ligand-binding sensor domain-containing protein [Spirochaetota bacterium]
MTRGNALLVLFLLAITAVAAQDTDEPEVASSRGTLPPLARGPRRLVLERVGLNDGLSQSTATTIAQGPDGFLWFGTPDGLNRYDGYGFLVYRDGDEGLGDDDITALHTDAAGALWIGTRHSGVFRYDPRSRSLEQAVPWRRLRAPVTAITHDAFGDLWIGTGSNGLFRLEPATGATAQIPYDPFAGPTLSSPSVVALASDGAGRVFVATGDRGLNIVSAADATVEVHRYQAGLDGGVPSDRITSLHVDRSERLWIGTADGDFGRYLHRRRVWVHVPLEPPSDASASSAGGLVSAILEDSRGDLWVGRDGGSLVRLTNGSITGFGTCDAPVRALLEDASGVIWVGTFAGGLRKYVPRTEQFENFLGRGCRAGYASRPELVWSFHEEDDGRVLIATHRSGILRLGPDRAVPEPFWDAEGAPVHDVCAAGETYWLALGSRGAAQVDAEGTVLRRYPLERLGVDAHVISVHVAGGTAYLGTAGRGLVAIEPDGSTRRYATFGPPGADGRQGGGAVYTIVPAGDGSLWLGTDTAALLRFRPDTARIERLRLADEYRPGFTVWAIDPQPDGTLWIAAREGGALWVDPDEGVLFRLEPRVDVAADLVYGVVADRAGGVWLTTNSGLFRLDERTGETQRYTAADGVQSDEFSAGAILRASDATIYAGGINGFSRFEPARVQPSPYVPPVVISEVSVAGHEEIDWSDVSYTVSEGREIPTLVLPPQATHFSCVVSALDYTHPPSNAYAYRLIGVDREWISSGSRRVISYSNLAPGEYRLYVRGTNVDGLLNTQGVVMDIVVQPPFWRTEWFALLSIYVVVAVLFLFVWRRLQLARAKRVELEAMVERRTKDLATSKRTLEREIEIRRRAESSLRQIQSELERRVALRTKALRDANELLAQEVRDREAAQQETNRTLRENKALLQEIHHRVKNNMQVISSLLSLQAGLVDDERALHGFEISRQRINAMALIHERLYQSGDFSSIEMADYFASLISSLTGLHGGAFQVKTHVHASPLDITVATPCGLVTNELATNAMKHAFRGTEPSSEDTILVEFVEEDGEHRLTIADNGAGIESLESLQDSATLGMRIVEVLVQQLGGTMTIRTGMESVLGRGTEFTVRF